jgi:dienelactone hydrolase
VLDLTAWDTRRSEIRSFLSLAPKRGATSPLVHDEVHEAEFTRKTVSYVADDGETVQAFFFQPLGKRHSGAVVMLHQHNSEWALGKSEIAGLAGDPLQAFGPALARAGVAVLAPDAIGFESRCGQPGANQPLEPEITRPYGSVDGWRQYYNHAMHRLVRGKLLMTKVLSDVDSALSALQILAKTDHVGVAGHSHGGNVTLFAAALNTRIEFACSSGAACSFRHKLEHGTGLEMALVIPGFAERFDLDDLMRCISPRPLFIVSSDNDAFAADASELVANTKPAFVAAGAEGNLAHMRTGRGHALDTERFNAIVEWLVERAGAY